MDIEQCLLLFTTPVKKPSQHSFPRKHPHRKETHWLPEGCAVEQASKLATISDCRKFVKTGEQKESKDMPDFADKVHCDTTPVALGAGAALSRGTEARGAYLSCVWRGTCLCTSSSSQRDYSLVPRSEHTAPHSPHAWWER